MAELNAESFRMVLLPLYYALRRKVRGRKTTASKRITAVLKEKRRQGRRANEDGQG